MSGMQKLRFRADQGERKLSIVVAFKKASTRNSIVARVGWTDPAGQEGDLAALPYSERLKSRYFYLPQTVGKALVDGPVVQLPGQGELVIDLLTWPEMQPVPPGVVTGIFVRTLEDHLGAGEYGMIKLLEVAG